MEQFKRVKCILLDTQNDDFQFQLSGFNILTKDNGGKRKHLYIISDDEIKEGDWVMNDMFKLFKADIQYITSPYRNECTNHKKIIATTDTSLGLPQPSQQFIEKYIESYNKGEVITDILVEYYNPYENLIGNKIGSNVGNFELTKENSCKLKINPKDNTITIKKLKDSWNREEVIELLTKLNHTLNIGSDRTFEEWIEENL